MLQPLRVFDSLRRNILLEPFQIRRLGQSLPGLHSSHPSAQLRNILNNLPIPIQDPKNIAQQLLRHDHRRIFPPPNGVRHGSIQIYELVLRHPQLEYQVPVTVHLIAVRTAFAAEPRHESLDLEIPLPEHGDEARQQFPRPVHRPWRWELCGARRRFLRWRRRAREIRSGFRHPWLVFDVDVDVKCHSGLVADAADRSVR